MKKSILIAEDSESYRSVLKAILAKEGYEILEAASGSDAVEVFKTESIKIDLMLLDFRLRDMTALEVLEEMKDTTTPKLVVSGEPAGIHKDLVKPFNVMGWLTKPCDLNQLKKIIATKIFI